MNYVIISLFGIAVLVGLVGFGVGHRRQNWGTVAAAFLVLIAAAGYVYLGARLAAYEWKWERVIRGKKERIALLQDALRPNADAGGRLEAMPVDEKGRSHKSLEALRVDLDRWQRALDRVNTWRDRSWKATFQPPALDPKAASPLGTIEIVATPPAAAPEPGQEPAAPAPPQPGAGEQPAADGAAAAAPGGEAAEPAAEPAAAAEAAAEPARAAGPVVPVNPGATLYVFDDRPIQSGGRYVGAFLVQEATYDAEAGRFRITVAATQPADTYDREAWSQAYDAVTVYENLPVDRWLAFYETPKADAEAEGDPVSPQPVKAEPRAKEVASDVATLQQFLEQFQRHERHDQEEKDSESWKVFEDQLSQGQALPGEYWAAVTFTKEYTFGGGRSNGEAGGGEPPGDGQPAGDGGRGFEAGDKAEFDLQTAEALKKEGKVEIDRVFYRRPLHDALTLMYGSWIAVRDREGIMADGIAALVQALQRDIDGLRADTKVLDRSRTSVDEELSNVGNQERMLEDDMNHWRQDATRAAAVADAFRKQVDIARKGLEDAEREIVRQGRDLSAAMGRLARKIDTVAPPTGRGESGPGAAAAP